MTTHTPFSEIIMRAWVAGWSDAVAGSLNDNGKRYYTRTAITRHPEYDVAPALLAALKTMIECHDAGTGANPPEMVWDEARAAVAQAEKEA